MPAAAARSSTAVAWPDRRPERAAKSRRGATASSSSSSVASWAGTSGREALRLGQPRAAAARTRRAVKSISAARPGVGSGGDRPREHVEPGDVVGRQREHPLARPAEGRLAGRRAGEHRIGAQSHALRPPGRPARLDDQGDALLDGLAAGSRRSPRRRTNSAGPPASASRNAASTSPVGAARRAAAHGHRLRTARGTVPSRGRASRGRRPAPRRLRPSRTRAGSPPRRRPAGPPARRRPR